MPGIKNLTAKRKSEKIKIKSVIFDLGNVLLNFNAKKSAKRFAKKCKVPVTKIWNHFFTDPTEKAYTRGEITCQEFYEHAQKSLHLPIDFETFRFYWNDIFWENAGMDPLLDKLRKNYPLYLISNTNKMHFDHIKEEFLILRHFKKTFPSHEVGHRKPDPKIYKKVLKAIKLKPQETVFVDDVEKFVDGARAVGMHAIQFKNPRQLVRELTKLGVKI
jgi:epoxide hydrolase-like predicted phosphatase